MRGKPGHPFPIPDPHYPLFKTHKYHRSDSEKKNHYLHTMDFNYKINTKGNYAIVEINGNLIDKTQASPLLDEVQDLINKGTNSFVISMGNFKYLNSNGLNVLVNILTKSR